MNSKRIAVAVCVLVFMTTRTTAAEGADFSKIRLNDRELVLLHAPWQETMTVMDAGQSLIVVDAWGSLEAAKRAKALIDSTFHKPVRLVINTHHHWDHTFGNAAFAGAAAEIVGHRFCAEDMKADYADAGKRRAYFEWNASTTSNAPLREYIRSAGGESSEKTFRLVVPNRLADERDTLRVDGLTVFLYHTPGIHTRSNLTVFIPELGIVFGRWEFADPAKMKLEPEADPMKIARVLEEILASDKPVRYLIPGHGSPVENPDLKAGAERLRGMGQK
jgi:glyoxylase-like metal-dependent hydrolase (beta-lactamase superfamily II)